jgi:cation-transporting ATPase 13A2
MLRALDLITIVVPPALPATLTIGTTFAIERLRKKGIFCISPNRVNIGGKINVICFDKTGTLTEDGLDVLGVRSIDRHTRRFAELHSEVADVPTEGGIQGRTPLLYALATCHALRLIDGEVLGDPLDVKMFEYTGWTLDEGQSRPVTAKGTVGSGERPQALVQTVVRPPGTEKWRMEDALKSGSKVSWCLHLCATVVPAEPAARAFPRTRCDPDIRLCLGVATDECHRQAAQIQQHGDLRQGCARGHAGYL